jgi:hypothetical protein
MKAERAVRSLLVLGILVICGIAVVPRSGFAEQGSGGSAADLTQKLLGLNAQYRAAPRATQAILQGELLSTAAARQQLLARLIETDPHEVLRVRLLPKLLALKPGTRIISNSVPLWSADAVEYAETGTMFHTALMYRV